MFASLDLSAWILLTMAAFCIGISKAGFSGASIISVFLFAQILGAKQSIGFALPMLIIADLIVYPVYKKHASWKAVWPLIWPALIGIAIGVAVISHVDNHIMRRIIGGIILAMAFIQILSKANPDKFYKAAINKYTGITAAILGGIATSLANAAGPVMRIYMISRRMEKLQLLGVGARFFLVINIIKLPLHSKLDLITSGTLLVNAILSPAIALGIISGYQLVKITPQPVFQITVIIFAIISGAGLAFF